jgi:hypothetical protein
MMFTNIMEQPVSKWVQHWHTFNANLTGNRIGSELLNRITKWGYINDNKLEFPG